MGYGVRTHAYARHAIKQRRISSNSPSTSAGLINRNNVQWLLGVSSGPLVSSAGAARHVPQTGKVWFGQSLRPGRRRSQHPTSGIVRAYNIGTHINYGPSLQPHMPIQQPPFDACGASVFIPRLLFLYGRTQFDVELLTGSAGLPSHRPSHRYKA